MKALEQSNPLLLVDLLQTGKLVPLIAERVKAFNLELARMTPGKQNSESLQVEESLLPMLTDFATPDPRSRPLTNQERAQVDEALDQWAETFSQKYEVMPFPA